MRRIKPFAVFDHGAMSTPHLIASMRTACSAALHFGPQLSGAVLLRLGYLCLALFTAVGKAVHQSGDPRLVLAQLQLVERFSQQLHRDQLAGALDAQASGAHALSLESYAALRLPEDDPHAITDDLFAGPPPVVQGRSCHKNAEELLAAWLGIAYFEAQRRIADAHLLIGRRTPDGSICAPRFTELAKLYDQGTANRRAIASAARRLEKLEPQDTTFEGTATELVARGDDGRTLDEFAAQTLKDLGPRAAQKKINSAIKTYKQTHGKQLPPKLGFFPGPVVNGVHFFSLRTNATDAQLIHSVCSQSGNPRTEAGRADHQASQEQPEGAGEDIEQNDEAEAGTQQESSSACQEPGPVPEWLRSEQPMPPWAAEASEDDADEPDGEEHPPNTEAHDDPAAEPDQPLRRLNAFMALLRAPFTGGKRKVIIPKCVVYLWHADLQNLADAHGMSANGVDIPPGELRQMLARANIIPVVLGGNSQVLDMGRRMRYHQGPIREAILARDRGCIVPDCTAPRDQVEMDHYLKAWSEGGETSVYSGAGMCTKDHHKRHAGQLKVLDVDGLPHVLLPEHQDPEQIPRRNTYWDARQAGESPARTNSGTCDSCNGTAPTGAPRAHFPGSDDDNEDPLASDGA
ncbi:MAG TPA: HNH endonuclease [Glutamicibacter sp.]|nr:HNH endonuclease [Glutamicibacter sp.]